MISLMIVPILEKSHDNPEFVQVFNFQKIGSFSYSRKGDKTVLPSYPLPKICQAKLIKNERNIYKYCEKYWWNFHFLHWNHICNSNGTGSKRERYHNLINEIVSVQDQKVTVIRVKNIDVLSFISTILHQFSLSLSLSYHGYFRGQHLCWIFWYMICIDFNLWISLQYSGFTDQVSFRESQYSYWGALFRCVGHS